MHDFSVRMCCGSLYCRCLVLLYICVFLLGYDSLFLLVSGVTPRIRSKFHIAPHITSKIPNT